MKRITLIRSVLLLMMLINGHFLPARALMTGNQPASVASPPPKKGIIYGVITDAADGEPLPSATIRILQRNDSSLVTGTSAGNDGFFSVTAEPGNYLARISFMGYRDLFKALSVTSAAAVTRLDTLALSRDNILLAEAIITAAPPEIVVKGDTLEYDAAAHKVTEMAVLEDLLRELSGVEIDADGSITVNGKDIKKILVNGKEFFSDDPKIASRNLPAKMVEKLQVLDNKSESEKMTGFDDGEEEMVINLTVKPDMRKGAFGNAFAGYGSKGRRKANAMVNYMRGTDQLTLMGGWNNTNNAGYSDLASEIFGGMGGRQRNSGGRNDGNGITQSGNAGLNFSTEFSKQLEIGGNIRYGKSQTESLSRIYTQNFLSKGDTYELELDSANSSGNNLNMDLRLEWKPDSLTSITFRPNITFQGSRRDESGNFITTRENGDTVNAGNSAYRSHGNGNNYGLSLNFVRRFKKQGRSLSIGLGGGGNQTRNKASSLSNTRYGGTRADDLVDQRISIHNGGANWRGSFSYIEPISAKKFLQFSYNYRNTRSESDKDTRTPGDEGDYTVFDTKYSKRQSSSSVHQDIGLTLRSKDKKYNYALGFSLYPTASRRKTLVGDSLLNDLKQDVTNYAPHAQFNYIWSKQKNLRFTYNGSTEQPTVNQLSPVTDITNPLNITYGNPELKPSFNHRADLRYQHSQPQEKRFYLLSAGFNYTSNDIVNSRFTDPETGLKENTYQNVNGNWNSNIRFNTTQPLFSKKFTLSSNSSASYRNNKGFSNLEKNTSRQINLSENLGLNYNSREASVSLRSHISYNKVANSLQGQQNREYFNYGATGNIILYLPYDWHIQSDIRYSGNSGYSAGFQQNEILWNASVEKQILRQKNGIIRFKIYDILQQRSNIRRNVSSNFIRDTTTNTLSTYFIVHAVYRFNVFSGGRPRRDMRGNEGLAF